MTVAYISAGQAVRATQLNALTAELDAAMRCLFADKSPYIYNHGKTLPLGERFYFGTSASWRIISQLFPSATTYDHTTFETAAAAFTVDTYHNDTETADTTQADPWPLNGSLEAHTTEDSGTTYYWRQDKDGAGDYGKCEAHKRFAVAEILIEALGSTSWTWDAKFNKYHFLRFHNFDLAALTITLPGGSTVVVPPLGVRAVRRTYPAVNSWDTSYTYLWAARSGDWLLWDSVPENNVASLQSYHAWINSLGAGSPEVPGNSPGGGPGFHIDPTVVWDGSALLPQSISGTVEVFKYEKHLGKMVIYEDAASGTPIRTENTPTWATLAAGTGKIKLATATGSVPHVLTLQADTGATTPVDVFAPESTLIRRHAATLPLVLSSTYEGVGTVNPPDARRLYGAESLLSSTTYQYITQPGSVGVDVDLDITFNSYGTGNAYWISTSTASLWSSLNTVATLESGSGTEQTSAPTITWKSDGWRLVACAETSIPVALAVWPVEPSFYTPDLALATVSSAGFTVKCGGDVLGRDTWDITSRVYGRKLSEWIGYVDAGTHYYTGHPDYPGGRLDPQVGGVEMVESRQPVTGWTMRTESIGITAVPTETFPVYPTADVAERLAEDDSAAAYAANRSGWTSNTLTNADKETLVRLWIIGMHYNHVAQRINGIMSIVPYTHASLVWYGGSDLEDDAWTGGNPPGMHCGVLSTGSRAAAIGLTVSSMTIDSTTQYYCTRSGVAAWCDTYGIRYFALQLAGMYEWNTGNIGLLTSYTTREDNTQPHRWFPAQYAYLYRTVEVDDGSTRGPVGVGGSLPGNYEAEGAMLEFISVREDGTSPPSGWALQTTNYVMTWTNDVVHYDNDPLSATALGFNEEPFDVYTADANAPAIWDASTLPQYITVDDVDALYGGSGAGSRAFYRMALLPRFFFRRT